MATGINVFINSGAILTDKGTLTVTSPSFVRSPEFYQRQGNTSGIVVNGVMMVSDTKFSLASNGNDTTKIEVKSGGHLTATNCVFAWEELNLDAGSADNLQFNAIATQLTVDSGATPLVFTYNDLSSANASVVATGGSTTTVDLRNNYWATPNPTGKITSKGPTVLWNPVLTEKPADIVAANAAVIFNSVSQNVTLSGVVLSPSGIVNEGTATFTIPERHLPGSATRVVRARVVNDGPLSVTYGPPPPGFKGNAYTIQAVYNGTANYLGYTDTSHVADRRSGDPPSPARPAARPSRWAARAPSRAASGFPVPSFSEDNTDTLPSGVAADLPRAS